MKNKRGFTLIELLAVIVILAIIALIATPVILNIINDAKVSSNERSIEIYLDSVKKAIATKNLHGEFNPDYCEIENGTLICDEEELIVSDNFHPSEGIIYFDEGKVFYYTLTINGETYSNGDFINECFSVNSGGTIVDYGNAVENGVTKIGTCPKRVVIPIDIDGVAIKKIGYQAFKDKGISSIKFSGEITTIEEEAFYNNNISYVSIPSSVSVIGYQAFANNPLTSVVITRSSQDCTSVTYNNQFGSFPISSIYCKGVASIEPTPNIPVPEPHPGEYLDF